MSASTTQGQGGISAPTQPAKAVGDMTPKELLQLWTYLAYLAAMRRASSETEHVAPAKGARGVRRQARRLRKRAHARRLQRITMRAYGEAVKREAA